MKIFLIHSAKSLYMYSLIICHIVTSIIDLI